VRKRDHAKEEREEKQEHINIGYMYVCMYACMYIYMYIPVEQHGDAYLEEGPVGDDDVAAREQVKRWRGRSGGRRFLLLKEKEEEERFSFF
jgi:hypothetical protein